MHVQQQILDAVVTALKAAPSLAGVKVYLEPIDVLPAGTRRAIVITESADGEQAEEYTISGTDKRQFPVLVGCRVVREATYAQDARELGLLVEKVLAADPSLRTLCKLGVRIAGSRLQLDGDGETAIAERMQRWVMSYIAKRAAPDVAL